MNLLGAITRDTFRNYIKAAYAKSNSLRGDMSPVEELCTRFFSLFGIDADCMDTELFVFDGRYMIVVSPRERRDLEEDSDVIYASPGTCWMYLMDITGDTDGGLADYCAKPLNREFPEVQALLC